MKTKRALGWAILSAAMLGCAGEKSGREELVTLSGTASYRERIATPAGSQLKIVLEDTSLAAGQAEAIAETTLIDIGQPPFAFALHYAPSRLDSSHRYNVRAHLTNADQLLFTTDQNYPVLASGPPTSLQLLLVRAAGSTDSLATTTLLDTYWKLTHLGEAMTQSFDAQREPHLVLHGAEQRLTGSDGCNELSGEFRAAADSLHFSKVATTLMACPQGMDQARNFGLALSQVVRYALVGAQLEFFDGDGAMLARFEAAAVE